MKERLYLVARYKLQNGHGYVYPKPSRPGDKSSPVRASCGGPPYCWECASEVEIAEWLLAEKAIDSAEINMELLQKNRKGVHKGISRRRRKRFAW